MPISNYNTGFPNGVTIREVPVLDIQNGDGEVYWVDSTKGSNINKGTFIYPFQTIEYAIGRCIANRGDKIFVAAGHIESVIAVGGLKIDVDGITIYFMGEGSDTATIDFSTSTLADVQISSDNITLVNPRFTASIDNLAAPILITGANCQILNGTYYDGVGIDSAEAIVATSAATNLIINGWTYFLGDGAGTPSLSHILLSGVDNAVLKNINIAGDFSKGNIENVVDELLNLRLENIILKNTNAVVGTPCIVLDADCTGQAKNLDLRVSAGSTYVSSLAKMNWDNNCIGYNADGSGGDIIGGSGGGGGSSSENGGLVLNGICDSTMTPSTTVVSCLGLASLAEDVFNNKYYMQIIKNNNSAGTAPETEVKKITNYVSSTGTFTTDAFSANVEPSDVFLVLHESQVIVGRNDADNVFDTTLVVANADGSLVERQEYIQTVSDTLNTNLGDPSGDTLTSITAKIGDDASTIAANFDSLDTDVGTINTNVGDASGDTLTSVVSKIGDGSTALVDYLENGLTASGSTFFTRTTLISSNILAAGTDLTEACTGGDLYIDDIVCITDNTLGLAGGTNIQIYADNITYGQKNMFSEPVTSFGAGKTVDLAHATVVSTHNILRQGAKMRINNSTADCTGAGLVVVYIKYRRVVQGADVASA